MILSIYSISTKEKIAIYKKNIPKTKYEDNTDYINDKVKSLSKEEKDKEESKLTLVEIVEEAGFIPSKDHDNNISSV